MIGDHNVETEKALKGFTMVELLISMALFLSIVSISSVIFINSLKNQRLLVSLMAINDNVSLVLEQMAREIRTGSSFSGGGSELNFVNAAGQAVTYRLNAAKGVLERGIGVDFSSITAENVNVKNFKTALSGQLAGDGASPKITVSLEISGKSLQLQSVSTVIQTTVSARNIDT